MLWPGDWIEAGWIITAAVWLITAFAAKRTVRRQSVTSRVMELWPLVVGGVLLYARSLGRGLLAISWTPRTLNWEIAGAVITWIGIAFAIWARLKLGRNWSGTVTVKENHQLIRSGPYALVRHPIYTGLLLAIFGTAMFAGEVRGLLALLLVFVGCARKMRHEEAFMTEEFGAQYEEYRRQVKALIPFVW